MSDFNWGAFDAQVNVKEVEEAVAKSASFQKTDLPKGTYHVAVDSIELTQTKNKPVRPMMKAVFNIMDGEFKKRKMFLNRVLISTNSSTATANLISGAVQWLSKLEPVDVDGDPITVDFHNFGQFAALIEEVSDSCIETKSVYEVEYDPEEFDAVKILSLIG